MLNDYGAGFSAVASMDLSFVASSGRPEAALCDERENRVVFDSTGIAEAHAAWRRVLIRQRVSDARRRLVFAQ